MSEGKRLISALLREGEKADAFFKFGLVEDLFMNDEEKALFKRVEKHALKFGVIPEAETIGFSPMAAPEPPAYYVERLETRLVRQRLIKSMTEANEGLKGEKEPHVLLDQLVDSLVAVDRILKRNEIIDLRLAEKMVMAEYKRRMLGQHGYMQLGWPSFDSMSGGLCGGDVVSVCGRPAAGKTFMLLYAAMSAWRQGIPVMLVSTEMAPMLLIQRLTGMLSGVNYGKLKRAEMSTYEMTLTKKALKQAGSSEAPFWIIDSTLTPHLTDVIRTAHQLRPGGVFIDGAYMLSPDQYFRGGVYDKVGETAREIKVGLAADMNVPVVASYQFNRDAAKSKGGKTLENIGYSDVIGQVSSIVLGLMEHESIETLQSRKIDLLKGRSGEIGCFYIKWLFDNMDFSELSGDEMNKQLQHL